MPANATFYVDGSHPDCSSDEGSIAKPFCSVEQGSPQLQIFSEATFVVSNSATTPPTMAIDNGGSVAIIAPIGSSVSLASRLSVANKTNLFLERASARYVTCTDSTILATSASSSSFVDSPWLTATDCLIDIAESRLSGFNYVISASDSEIRLYNSVLRTETTALNLSGSIADLRNTCIYPWVLMTSPSVDATNSDVVATYCSLLGNDVSGTLVNRPENFGEWFT